MTKHLTPHPAAGKKVRLKPDVTLQMPTRAVPTEIVVEDWWDRIAGKSWMDCEGNPACLAYAVRSGLARGPVDDEVVYGKVGPFGHLVHVTELADDDTAGGDT